MASSSARLRRAAALEHRGEGCAHVAAQASHLGAADAGRRARRPRRRRRSRRWRRGRAARPLTQTPHSSTYSTLTSGAPPAKVSSSSSSAKTSLPRGECSSAGLLGVDDDGALAVVVDHDRGEEPRRGLASRTARRPVCDLAVLGRPLVARARAARRARRVDARRGLARRPRRRRACCSRQGASSTRMNAATISGSNCVPLQRSSSARHSW